MLEDEEDKELAINAAKKSAEELATVKAAADADAAEAKKTAKRLEITTSVLEATKDQLVDTSAKLVAAESAASDTSQADKVALEAAFAEADKRMTATNAELAANKDAAAVAAATAAEHLTEVQSELSRSHEAQDELKAEAAASLAAAAEAGEQLEALKVQHKIMVSELGKKSDELAEVKATLEATEAAATEIAGEREDNDAATDKVAELEATIKTLESKAAWASASKEQIEASEAKQLETASEVERLESELALARAATEVAEAEAAANAAAAGGDGAAAAAAAAATVELEGQLLEAEEDKKILNDALEEKEKELAAKVADFEKVNAKLEASEAMTKELDEMTEILQEVHDEKEKKVVALEAELAELQGRHAELSGKMEMAAAQWQLQQDEAAKNVEAIELLNAELSSAQAAMAAANASGGRNSRPARPSKDGVSPPLSQFSPPTSPIMPAGAAVPGYKPPAKVFGKCIGYLCRPMTLNEEGLFRVSGSKTDIMKFSDSFRRGKSVKLARDCLEPATVCGLLKHEIRESDTPLTADAARAIGRAVDEDPNGVDRLRQVIGAINPSDSTVLCAMMRLFELIEQNPKNKMNGSNLGTSIGPTLFPGMPMRQHGIVMPILIGKWRELWDPSIVALSDSLMVQP